ncbi:hypothetical protein ACFP3Q_14485 [Nocardioides sp. GCM10027113]|uniref:hypothetical protein n=1 Tax=unclassified Nocardioides TaxID=2615069 RepID=UPI0036063CEF
MEQPFTPFDFGTRDPLAGGLGEFLERRVAELSGGTVREVSWEYDERVLRPVRRAKTTELDVHAPGDPGLEEYAEVARRLSAAIPDDTSDAAREVLHALVVAGVSRHRLWLAAPDDATEVAVRRTPGAGYALFAAVERVQRAQPLYRVVVDPTCDPALHL